MPKMLKDESARYFVFAIAGAVIGMICLILAINQAAMASGTAAIDGFTPAAQFHQAAANAAMFWCFTCFVCFGLFLSLQEFVEHEENRKIEMRMRAGNAISFFAC